MKKRTVLLAQINPGLQIIGTPTQIYPGVAYSFTFTARGGAKNKYKFTQSGTLPSGITFTDNGNGTATLAGTTSSAGVYPIIVTLGNSGQYQVSEPFTLTVNALTLQLVQTGIIYKGVALTAGQLKLVAHGGTGTGYTYSITSGTPAGLALNTSTGEFTGTPTTQTSYTVVATVTDSASNPAGVTANVVVQTVLVGVDVTPPVMEQGVPFSYTFSVSGATGAVTWSSTGTIPAGVTPITSGGILAGTPTGSGPYSFTVTATDAGTGCTLPITLGGTVWPGFTLVTPWLGPNLLPIGTTQNYPAIFSGGKPPYSISLRSVQNAALNNNLSIDGGNYSGNYIGPPDYNLDSVFVEISDGSNSIRGIISGDDTSFYFAQDNAYPPVIVGDPTLIPAGTTVRLIPPPNTTFAFDATSGAAVISTTLPSGTAFFYPLAVVDALGVDAETAIGNSLKYAINPIQINQALTVQQSGTDIGDPNPKKFNFVDATVTDDGGGVRSISGLRGPQGPTGPTGPTGATGPQGATGADASAYIGTTTNAGNDYTAGSPPSGGYVAGNLYCCTFNNVNTGAATLDGVDITKNGDPLTGGEIATASDILLRYNIANFNFAGDGGAAGGGASTAQIRAIAALRAF